MATTGDAIACVVIMVFSIVYIWLCDWFYNRTADKIIKNYLRFSLSYTGELDDFKDWLMGQGFVSSLDAARYEK